MNRSTISKESRLNLNMYPLKSSSSLYLMPNKLMAIFFDFVLLIKCAIIHCINVAKGLIEFGFKVKYQFDKAL